MLQYAPLGKDSFFFLLFQTMASQSSGVFSRLFQCCHSGGPKNDTDPYYSITSSGVRSTVSGSMHSTTDTVEKQNSGAIIFKMSDLQKATSNFSPSCKIGQGGFGVIYKGTLADGRTVAIKRGRKDLYESRLKAQFHSEVNMLAKVEHLNLVKLIGYLEEGTERIIVEEYVPNGNLRQHLDCEFGEVLDLSHRIDIAIDVSHALNYLHLYADQPIIHRDIKSSNILLTENLRAKVADFGFSRLGSLDAGSTHVMTQVKGTAGYLDPEYLKTYELTPKTDVFAFGILLVELVTGRKPIEQERDTEEKITVRWAYKSFNEGHIREVVDPKLEKSEAAIDVVYKVLKLAFRCAAPTRKERPTMEEASKYLWTIRKDSKALAQGSKYSGQL